MNACQNCFCFPRNARSAPQQVSQSVSHTEDSIWLTVTNLEDKFTSVDKDFGWSDFNFPFSQN